MTDIEALIVRLAAANEGSRELDAEIAALCHPTDDPRMAAFENERDYPDLYTESVDAAMTLVQEGYRLYSLSDQMDDSLGRWFAGVANDVPPIVNPPATSFMGHAPTPALALCIACLRARQQ